MKNLVAKKSWTKRLLALVMAAALVLSLSACSSDKGSGDIETIQIGVAGEYYPFCYTENDELQGFEIDTWNEIGKRLGKEVEFTVSDFTGLFGMLDSGKIDSIGHGVAINEDRAEKYYFSDPYLYSDFSVVTRDDSTLATIEEFEGKTIGVVMGGEGERKLKELCEEQDLDIEIKGYEGSSSMDEDVKLGRVDARLAPKIQTAANIAKNNLAMKITDITIYTETDAYPFPKEDKYDSFAADVNKVLSEMRADGTLSELSLKWFSIDATEQG